MCVCGSQHNAYETQKGSPEAHDHKQSRVKVLLIVALERISMALKFSLEYYQRDLNRKGEPLLDL